MEGLDRELQLNKISIEDNLEKINSQYANITANTEAIRDNNETITYIQSTNPPIGIIIAWVTKTNESQTENILDELPLGWMKCDGSEIPEDSPWAGLNTPNLNSEGRFLRGGKQRNTLELQDDSFQV